MSDFKAEVKLNLNANLMDEVHAMTDSYLEKLKSVFKMRCPEHDEPPRPVTVDGKLKSYKTCCDAFDKQVEEALEA